MEDLSAIIQFRLSPEQKRMAQKDAYWHEMDLSQYLRMLLDLGHAIRERKEGQK